MGMACPTVWINARILLKDCKIDKDGCPIDSDGDGVCDGLDKCPDTPKGVKVDASGCPLVKPIEQKITLHILYKLGSADIDDANKGYSR